MPWIGIGSSKFYHWKQRYGRVNEHNGRVPRDHWLEAWEKQAIVDFYDAYPLEGYRRLAFMMLDRDVVAASSATVYRVTPSWRAAAMERQAHDQGSRLFQPLEANGHWHLDVSYICGTFYYLCTLLDGCSHSILSLGDPRVDKRMIWCSSGRARSIRSLGLGSSRRAPARCDRLRDASVPARKGGTRGLVAVGREAAAAHERRRQARHPHRAAA